MKGTKPFISTPREFAERYLDFVLGDRQGCGIADDTDDDLREEIISELAALIDQRDRAIAKEALQ